MCQTWSCVWLADWKQKLRLIGWLKTEAAFDWLIENRSCAWLADWKQKLRLIGWLKTEAAFDWLIENRSCVWLADWKQKLRLIGWLKTEAAFEPFCISKRTAIFTLELIVVITVLIRIKLRACFILRCLSLVNKLRIDGVFCSECWRWASYVRFEFNYRVLIKSSVLIFLDTTFNQLPRSLCVCDGLRSPKTHHQLFPLCSLLLYFKAIVQLTSVHLRSGWVCFFIRFVEMCLSNGSEWVPSERELIETSQHSSPSGNIWRRQNIKQTQHF